MKLRACTGSREARDHKKTVTSKSMEIGSTLKALLSREGLACPHWLLQLAPWGLR